MYKRKKKNQFSSFVPKDHVTKYIPHAYQVQTYSGEIRLDFSTMIHFCSRWPSFLLILANESICGIFFFGYNKQNHPSLGFGKTIAHKEHSRCFGQRTPSLNPTYE